MNEERHEEIMNAISNLSAQFSELLREFKKRGELLHEADDATLSTNDLIDVLGVSKSTLNRLRQRKTIPTDTSRQIKWFILTESLSVKS